MRWFIFTNDSRFRFSKFINIFDFSYFTQTNCRYDSQVAVFGTDFQQKLLQLKYFLVSSPVSWGQVSPIPHLLGVQFYINVVQMYFSYISINLCALLNEKCGCNPQILEVSIDLGAKKAHFVLDLSVSTIFRIFSCSI